MYILPVDINPNTSVPTPPTHPSYSLVPTTAISDPYMYFNTWGARKHQSSSTQCTLCVITSVSLSYTHPLTISSSHHLNTSCSLTLSHHLFQSLSHTVLWIFSRFWCLVIPQKLPKPKTLQSIFQSHQVLGSVSLSSSCFELKFINHDFLVNNGWIYFHLYFIK